MLNSNCVKSGLDLMATPKFVVLNLVGTVFTSHACSKEIFLVGGLLTDVVVVDFDRWMVVGVIGGDSWHIAWHQDIENYAHNAGDPKNRKNWAKGLLWEGPESLEPLFSVFENKFWLGTAVKPETVLKH